MRRMWKLCAAAFVGTALWTADVGAYKVRGSVVGTGAHPAMGSSNGIHVLYGTIGQPAVGFSVGSNFGLCQGFWCAGGPRVLAVDPPDGGSIRDVHLGGPTPNPSTGHVEFEIALPRAEEVSLAIYDIRGRVIYRTSPQEMPAGHHTFRWDGDAVKSQAAAGVYFARWIVGGRHIVGRRIVMVR